MRAAGVPHIERLMPHPSRIFVKAHILLLDEEIDKDKYEDKETDSSCPIQDICRGSPHTKERCQAGEHTSAYRAGEFATR